MIAELMVTILIVSILVVTVGTFIVKLLTIHEREREEAYIRERLADVCGAYADFISVGETLGSRLGAPVVKYRQETGGVSLETGLVTRAAYLTSAMDTTNRTVDLNVLALEYGGLVSRFSRNVRGDASLIPLSGDMVSCTITPLGAGKSPTTSPIDETVGMQGFLASDAPLGRLQLTAKYNVENDDGELVAKTVTVERVVRLWNRE